MGEISLLGGGVTLIGASLMVVRGLLGGGDTKGCGGVIGNGGVPLMGGGGVKVPWGGWGVCLGVGGVGSVTPPPLNCLPPPPPKQ